MQARIQKWGNSLAVRIPKPLAEDAEVQEGTVLNLAVSGVAYSAAILLLYVASATDSWIVRIPCAVAFSCAAMTIFSLLCDMPEEACA